MPDTFRDSSPLLDDAPALRARAAEDGYLFFRGLLPPDELLAVRDDLLAVVARHGWLRADQEPHGGLVDTAALAAVPTEQMRTDIGVSVAAYDDVQRLESVHRMPHHPRLLEVYRTLFGSEVLVHPRHIVRLITPHPAVHPTPQHQDFPLIQGTPDTWTAWFPAGDCPRSMGPLTVLRGSHRLGYLPIEPALGAGGIAAQTCPGEDDWVAGDFQLGDVLTFSAYTVHRALPCQHRDRVRLSFDVRYQPLDEPVEARSLAPHCALSWDDIYDGWQARDLQRYWERLPLRLSEFDETLLQPGPRAC